MLWVKLLYLLVIVRHTACFECYENESDGKPSKESDLVNKTCGNDTQHCHRSV